MIKEFWNKLEPKQRKMVAGAAIFVVMALILEMVVFPFWEAKGKLNKSIISNQKRLAELRELETEFVAREAVISRIKRNVSMRGSNFSLFSYLEKKAAQANVRGYIKYMNSSKGAPSDSFEESLIDMKLDKITIKQLADFLYLADSPSDLVRIKKITINKMKESPEYLSVQLQVSSFQPLIQ